MILSLPAVAAADQQAVAAPGRRERDGGRGRSPERPGHRTSAARRTDGAADSGAASDGAASDGTANDGAAGDRAASDGAAREDGLMTRVLVVDDEPQILRALRINLRVRGYDVDIAADAASRRWRWPPAIRPTWSSSTSACPTWTASR